MFHSARLKLTAWYLLIIMCISIFFSIAIYNVSTRDIQRVVNRLKYEEENPSNPFLVPDLLSEVHIQNLLDAEEHLRWTLIIINATILLVSGGAGYFLAGLTLKPIQKMVDEQNRFITDASHELRTPLTALRSEMEATLLDKRLSSKDTKKLIESNLEEVVHIQTLSDDLLKLAQYEKKTPTALRDVSLLQIIEDALKKVAPLAKQKHILIENSLVDEIVSGDSTSLSQLFIILLDNAIKYSPNHTTITLAGEKIDHKVKVSLKDQGIGIEDKDIHQIFDRFYRVDKSRTSTDVRGYGLGLSIAKKIVEEHKGIITVKSKIHEGTTFTVTLPLK